MRNITAIAALVMLLTMVMGCIKSAEEKRSAVGPDRVHSSNGFSFLPPQGSGWAEELGKNEILYLKQTDHRAISFYAGALEGELASQIDTEAALLAFVRTKKEQWGNDDRYFATASSFKIEGQHNSCVRYSLMANDRDAKNKEDSAFLTMRASGRFCVHPENRARAVDLYYSVRHPPGFDVGPFSAEGETFIESLQFSSISLGSSSRNP